MEILQRELVYLWYYFSVQLEQIFPYWILGMLLGSAASVFLKDRIHTVFRSLGDRKLGVLGIAASFSKSGIKDDWLAAFMITGPATKITNLGAVKIVLDASLSALIYSRPTATRLPCSSTTIW